MEETLSHDAVFKALQMLKRVRRLEGTVLLHEGVLMNADTLLNERQVRDFVVEVNALVSQFRNGGRPLSRALIGFDGGNVLIFNARPYTLCLLFARMEEAETIERAAEEFLGKWADALHLEAGGNREFPIFAVDRLAVIEKEAEVVSNPTQPIAPVVAEPPPESVEGVKSVELAAVAAVAVASSPVPASPLTADPVAPVPTLVDLRAQGTEGDWQAFRLVVENLLSKVLGRAQATRLIDRELEGMGIAPGGNPSASQFRPFGMRLIQKIKDKSLRRQIEIEFIARVEDHLG
jgi:hypothetical protein